MNIKKKFIPSKLLVTVGQTEEKTQSKFFYQLAQMDIQRNQFFKQKANIADWVKSHFNKS
jgi:hypothetical protein